MRYEGSVGWQATLRIHESAGCLISAMGRRKRRSQQMCLPPLVPVANQEPVAASLHTHTRAQASSLSLSFVGCKIHKHARSSARSRDAHTHAYLFSLASSSSLFVCRKSSWKNMQNNNFNCLLKCVIVQHKKIVKKCLENYSFL